MSGLVHSGSQYHLLVDGKPFLILGGQAGNSSASNKQDLARVWESAVALHANTVEIPLYWELIEPQPGQFDFHTIDDIIQGARSHQLRLVLLWCGTWKNGRMSYTPDWIKENQTKYFRVRNDVGQPLDVISPFCEAAREEDSKAFGEVMQHIKSVDSQERTVIMMQVENETGLEGTDRDYSPQATRMYQTAVPSELMQYLEAHRGHLMPALEAALTSTHFRESGTWHEVFGDLAPEAFSLDNSCFWRQEKPPVL
jgi:beta-galactosidase GanA